MHARGSAHSAGAVEIGTNPAPILDTEVLKVVTVHQTGSGVRFVKLIKVKAEGSQLSSTGRSASVRAEDVHQEGGHTVVDEVPRHMRQPEVGIFSDDDDGEPEWTEDPPSAASVIFAAANILGRRKEERGCGLGDIERLSGRERDFFQDLDLQWEPGKQPVLMELRRKLNKDPEALRKRAKDLRLAERLEDEKGLVEWILGKTDRKLADEEQKVLMNLLVKEELVRRNIHTDVDPRIHAIFPLKNYDWIDDVQTLSCTENVLCCCVRDNDDLLPEKVRSETEQGRGSCSLTDCGAELCKWVGAWFRLSNPTQDYVLNQLQLRYGPRAAFYFGFLDMFCRGMIPLAMVSLVVLLLGYVMERLWYVRLLGLVGLLTASLWTPWLLASWRMRSNELLFRWDLRNTHMAPELGGPNPSYDRVGGDTKWSFGGGLGCREKAELTAWLLVAVLVFVTLCLLVVSTADSS